VNATRSEHRQRLTDLVLYASLILALAEVLGALAVPLSLRIAGYTLALTTLLRYHLNRSNPRS